VSDRLAEIRARLDAAPSACDWWVENGVYGICGVRSNDAHDADLIAHAPADIAWLLDEVERLEKRVRMYEVVKS